MQENFNGTCATHYQVTKFALRLERKRMRCIISTAETRIAYLRGRAVVNPSLESLKHDMCPETRYRYKNSHRTGLRHIRIICNYSSVLPSAPVSPALPHAAHLPPSPHFSTAALAGVAFGLAAVVVVAVPKRAARAFAATADIFLALAALVLALATRASRAADMSLPIFCEEIVS